MVTPESEARLETVVEQVRSALAASAVENPAVTTSEPVAADLVGEAADGLVRAVAGADGRLRSLSIAPELLRRPLADVGADVRTAINAALGARTGTVDASPFIDALRSARDEAMREMGVVTSGLQDVDGAVRATRAAQHDGAQR